MSISETRDVFRYHCDGISCVVETFHEPEHHERDSDVPVGWCRIALGGRWVIFHDVSCAIRWLTYLSIEERDTAGWNLRGNGR